MLLKRARMGKKWVVTSSLTLTLSGEAAEVNERGERLWRWCVVEVKEVEESE